jgi:basic membrane protein A
MRRHAVILAAAAVALLALAAAAGSSRPLTVGLVLETSAVSDPFQHGAFVGLQRAVRELGVKGKAVVPSPRQTSYLAGFAYLARQKYGLIVGLGFLEAADLDTAALKFPGNKFAIVDASLNGLKHRPRNVLGTHFKTEEADYLAGYLAALMEMRRPGKDVIGSVGGFKIPTVDAFIAGYQAGAKKADPGITVLNGYANDFLKQAKCKAVAQQQITAGAGVIFQVADICGLGALAAAEEKHVWGIGVDIDQSSLGPHILTSVLKHWDIEVYDTVQALVRGRLRGGHDIVWDLANGAVGLGRISSSVPQRFLRDVDRLRARIVAGNIHVPSNPSR